MEKVVNKVTKTATNNGLEAIKKTGKKVVEKLTSEPVQKKLVPVMDKMLFEQYMFAKNLSLKTSNDEIKNLFKLEGDEFFAGSYNFLLDKMGIPESLRPQVVSVPQNEMIGMAYNFVTNQLVLNPNCSKKGKIETYGFLRHEFQHLMQNLNVFRNLEIKEDVISTYANKTMEIDLVNFDYMVKNLSIEQLKEFGYGEEALKLFIEMKEIFEKEGEEKYAQKMNEIKEKELPEYLERFRAFSDLVLKEMGPLKQGSREANRSLKFFDEIFRDINYWKNDGSVHLGKYITDVRENEALIAGDVATIDVKSILEGEKTCYIQKMKKEMEILKQQVKSQEKQTEEILESSKEMNEKFSPKEYIDYVFN